MVYIIDAVRTPVGKYGGSLSHTRPDDLMAHVIKALVSRNPKLDVNAIEDVVAGDANQAGEDTRNVARMAALIADLPVTVPGTTVNRLCASGLQAVMDAARAILCSEGRLYIAGGVESMSRAPYILPRGSVLADNEEGMVDSTIGWRFANPVLIEKYHPWTMGETAENVAKRYTISRERQDGYALRSHEKYFEAKRNNRFKEEIVGIDVIDQKGHQAFFDSDEYPRGTSMKILSSLKPAFAPNGTVTAGNSSGLNDGAAALLLGNEQALEEFGFQPLARVVSMAVSGIDPAIMGMGPVEATRKALQRANLKVTDIDLVELNESFASQSLACIDELGFDPEKVNVNGGSLAIGHPLGCSGARISVTLIHEMKKRNARYGLAAMCAGMGQGAAVIFEGI